LEIDARSGERSVMSSSLEHRGRNLVGGLGDRMDLTADPSNLHRRSPSGL
jgi:hypothetical protein